jgi:magnesium transporter
MNFRYLPELEWEYGYYMVLGIAGLVVVGMLSYFKKHCCF